MARVGGDTSSWPMTITTAAHPQHELVHLLFLRNSCKVCGGALANKLGYRCERCDFDVHCECLPEHRTMARVGPVHAPPRPHAHHPPPSRPSSSHYATPPPQPPYHHQPGYTSAHHHVPPRFQPELTVSLSGSSNFDVPHHQQQQGGQTPPSPQPAQYYPAPQPQQQYYTAAPQSQQSYPAPPPPQQQSYGNYYGRGAEPDAPVSYNHLQQQQDYYPTTNNYGDYVDNYSAATAFGDTFTDDYYDSRDYGDGDDDY